MGLVGSIRVGFRKLGILAGRVGLGHDFRGSGRVQNFDPRATLRRVPVMSGSWSSSETEVMWPRDGSTADSLLCNTQQSINFYLLIKRCQSSMGSIYGNMSRTSFRSFARSKLANKKFAQM